MAERDQKKQYKPEELEEIERIVSTVPEQPIGITTAVASPPPPEPPAEEEEADEDMGLTPGRPGISEEEAAATPEDMLEDSIRLSEMEEGGAEPGEMESFEEAPLEELADFAETASREEVTPEDEMMDISDLVHEVEEPAPGMEDMEDLLSEEPLEAADISTEELMGDLEAFEPGEITDEETPSSEEPVDFGLDEGDEIAETGPDEEIMPGEMPGDVSPLDELEAIADEEPSAPEAAAAGEEMHPGVEGMEEISADELMDITSAEEAEVSGDAFADLDMPSVDEIGDEESPAEDVSELSPLEELAEAGEVSEMSGDELPGLDMGAEEVSFPDIEEMPEAQEPSHEPDMLDELSELPEDAAPVAESPPAEAPPAGEGEPIDLSDRELKKVKKALLLFSAPLRKEITRIILNDEFPAADTRTLVDMLTGGKKEDEIRKFVEQKSGKKITAGEGDEGAGRRVISARPEYTVEGRERQKRLLKATRIAAGAAAAVFLVTILSYQYIYKPIMAKKYIDEGAGIIRQAGEPVTEKMKDYRKAEELFRNVDENYAEDYLYGYNSYARAYFDKKEYDFALEKLNRAYNIDKSHIETINNLGYFYSRVPERYYERIKPRIPDYYYKDIKPVPEKSQLDVAIDFYRRSLNIDPDNITSLYGIGNAYYYQGRHGKAKEYYEKIVQEDENSAVGYSGLLNLYIERDELPEVLRIHSKLRYREIVSDVPSALLAKTAAYYLSKKRTDDMNIRVDYGIQTKRVRDISDNPYPVVRSVLNELKEKDLDYPPLYLHYARLYRELKSYNLMERSLEEALKKEPDYFGALHLLGDYHYLVKEPEKAYDYYNRAIAAYNSQPEFTRDDFYYETENIGNTYLMLGNIFYYFFDTVKYRFGDELEEWELDSEMEKLANYEIAREKYEKALEEGYGTPELYYNLGRIYYIKGQYEKAAGLWRNLYEDFTKYPELMFSLGNAFYFMNNFESAKGEYLKLISVYEERADDVRKVLVERSDHIKIFQTLSSAYNNLGAVFQIQNNETKCNISYWKAVEYAGRIDRENEFARVNLARAFKPGRESVPPLVDKNIPFSIDIYREDMR